MPEMKTLICPGPPEHEFLYPSKRGRPPKFCDEHKGNSKSDGEKKMTETRKPPPGAARPAPPAPGVTRKPPRVSAPEKGELDEPTENTSGNATMTESGSIKRLPPPGKADTQSRAKAENAAKHADAQQTDTSWPLGANGRPMARIEFSASELIPTGQYANVSVGPARITAFVDLHRAVDDGEAYFSQPERDNLVKAVNELAEMVERDVVAVQRNLVLESIQEQRSDG
jgi:hypothetical protein